MRKLRLGEVSYLPKVTQEVKKQSEDGNFELRSSAVKAWALSILPRRCGGFIRILRKIE